MIKNFEELPFDVLVWGDDSYRLTFRRLPPLLRVSVREVGVLNPLIVVETLDPGRYAIVTGWLRSQAAREVGENSVPCHIYRNFPQKILLLCSFFDNLGHRKQNLVEMAITLRKLSEHYTQQEVIEIFLPLLGYRPHVENWKKLIPFSDLGEEMKWALADGALAEQAALMLHRFPAREGERVFRLLHALRMSDSVQREVAENFYEIWRRDEVTPSAILEEEKWEQGLGELQAPKREGSSLEGHNVLQPDAKVRFSEQEPRHPPKLQAQYERTAEMEGDVRARRVQAVREGLRRRRFPRLKAMEDAYEAQLRALKLPPGARLTPTPYFERTTQKLEVQFDSPGELRKVLEKLLDAEERGLLAQLFALQKA